MDPLSRTIRIPGNGQVTAADMLKALRAALQKMVIAPSRFHARSDSPFSDPHDRLYDYLALGRNLAHSGGARGSAGTAGGQVAQLKRDMVTRSPTIRPMGRARTGVGWKA